MIEIILSPLSLTISLIFFLTLHNILMLFFQRWIKRNFIIIWKDIKIFDVLFRDISTLQNFSTINVETYGIVDYERPDASSDLSFFSWYGFCLLTGLRKERKITLLELDEQPATRMLQGREIVFVKDDVTKKSFYFRSDVGNLHPTTWRLLFPYN